jgi:hypothetical protein
MPAAAVAEGSVGKSSPKKESHSSMSTLPSPSPSSLLRSAADLSFVNCGLKTSPTCTATKAEKIRPATTPIRRLW